MKDKLEQVALIYEKEVIIVEGFDNAIIGYTENSKSEPLAVYSYDKLIEVAMIESGMTNEDAIDYIEYNIMSSLPKGDNSPVIMYNFD